VWDINPILNEKSTLGSILMVLFGYNGAPSLLVVIAYGVYSGVVGIVSLWQGRAMVPAAEMGS
jgi:high-affinity Fe2+/Pb2+ permease